MFFITSILFLNIGYSTQAALGIVVKKHEGQRELEEQKGTVTNQVLQWSSPTKMEHCCNSWRMLALAL